jgi:hypothetical protein
MKKHKTRRSYVVKAAMPKVEENKLKKVYSYGVKDNLPNELIRAIGDSGTARVCVSRLKTFIIGSGFINDQAKTFRVNKKQLAPALLADIAPSAAVFEAVAFRILYKLDGLPGSIYRVPIKTLRRTTDGTWIYNHLKGEVGYKENENVYIRNYTPNVPAAERIKIINDEIAKHGEQLGEIWCDFQIKEDHNGDIYPIPDCYSGIEDIRSDASLQRLDERNIRRGFKAQAIFAYPGEIDTETEDEEGKTEWDYLNADIKEFTSEEANSVLILQSKVAGEKPEITPFPIADILNGTEKTRDRIPRAVCRHLSVPPVLVGMEVANILGNNAALVNSIKVFAMIVTDRQAMITRMLTELFPGIDWSIGQANIFEYLPPEVIAKLTDDELRALGKYAPLPKADEKTQKIIDRLNTLNPIVSAEIIKRMGNNDLLKLIGIEDGTTN